MLSHLGKSGKAEEMHRRGTRAESDGARQGVSFDTDEHGQLGRSAELLEKVQAGRRDASISIKGEGDSAL